MQRKRVLSFDGLKGLAIISVIAYHLFPSIFPGGFLLVNTFLVVGGYFFARSFEKLQSYDAPLNFSGYGQLISKTIQRLFYPLLWMIMAIVIGWLFIHPVALKSVRNDLLSGLFFYNNLFQIFSDRSYFVQMTSASPFTHLWYVAIYMQSLVIASILMMGIHQFKLSIPSKGIIWIVIATMCHTLAIFIYQPGRDPSRVYYGIDTRFASFALGIATAYMVPTLLNILYRFKYKNWVYHLLALASLGGAIALVFTQNDRSDITYMLWMAVYNWISAGLIISITIGAPILSLLLSVKPLYLLGRRSYSYYLWYYPIIIFYLSQYRRLGENIHLIAVASIVTILLIGELSYRWIEQDQLNIWFGTHWDWKQDSQEIITLIEQRQFLHFKFFKFFGFIVLCLLFIRGLIASANDKSLATFDLEYRLYQQSVHVQSDDVYPAARELVKTQEFIKDIDQQYQTLLSTELVVQDPMKQLAAILKQQPEVDLSMIDNLLAEHEEAFENAEVYHPIVFNELTSSELLFATEVPVTIFGDSLAFITGPYAIDVFQNGNYFGESSLQIWDALPMLRELVQEGVVKENVVVILGTNAGLDQPAVDELMEILGPDRNVFLVNTNSRVFHIKEVNDIIKATSEKFPNAYEVDWYNYQKGNPDWYTFDEIHHSELGMEHFIVIVTRTMYQVFGADFITNLNQ